LPVRRRVDSGICGVKPRYLALPVASDSLTQIAETGGPLRDFGPYAAALNEAGTVAFRADLVSGGVQIFVGMGGTLEPIALPPGVLIGHPEINATGNLSLLIQEPAANPCCWLLPMMGGKAQAHGSSEIAAVGPRGPVMNEQSQAVFCARLYSGAEGLYLMADGSLEAIATTGEQFLAFPGLPVINQAGDCTFCAERRGGGRVILRRRGAALTEVAATGGAFCELGAFPSLDEAGRVAFTGRLQNGLPGAFLWSEGELRQLAISAVPFASLRSALLHGADGLVLCATPRGGELGVYRVDGASARRILGLGDPFAGSTIADFALNAVSINAAGQIALRLRLANGRQFILRVEPSAP